MRINRDNFFLLLLNSIVKKHLQFSLPYQSIYYAFVLVPFITLARTLPTCANIFTLNYLTHGGRLMFMFRRVAAGREITFQGN